jgi:hypothetical protein
MNKKNIVRFAHSLVILPLMTGAVPFGSNLKVNPTNQPFPTVFTQKQDISDETVALNEALEAKAKDLKSKADAIDSYFKSHDMPLYGMGMKMAEEADKNGLDWRLLPAISIRESSGGKQDCVQVDNNPFGWGSCKIGFKSNEEAIETVAENLGGNNPTTESHYANKTLKQILHAYNPPSVVPRYAEQVISIMNTIGTADLPVSVAPNS